MTRALSIGRPGTELFPEGAKQAARDMGLEKNHVEILELKRIPDAGGDHTDEWISKETVDGRVDPMRRAPAAGLTGGALTEGGTHIATLEPTAKVKTTDRLRMEGRDWVITAAEIHTDQATVSMAVRAL